MTKLTNSSLEFTLTPFCSHLLPPKFRYFFRYRRDYLITEGALKVAKAMAEV